MSKAFVTPEQIEDRAKRDFERGEECPFNWHSKAAKTWNEVIDRLKAERDAANSSLSNKGDLT